MMILNRVLRLLAMLGIIACPVYRTFAQTQPWPRHTIDSSYTETGGLQKNGLGWINGKDLHKSTVPFHSISGVHNAKYDKAELLDLDQDGDLDLLICEENYGENSKGLGVIWYENPHK